MAMHDRDDANERVVLDEDDREREPSQQLATNAKLAR